MNEFLYGVLGTVFVLSLLAAGVWAGWSARKHHESQRSAAPSPSEKQRQRMIEEQMAFEQLSSYSTERAYGMVSDEHDARKGEGA